jgi:hypothetical protein
MANEHLGEITVFRKTGGILSERIWLDDKGKVIKNGSACVMAHGIARRVEIPDVGAYASLINACPANEALALGRLKDGLPAEVKVVTADELNGGSDDPTTIARTREFLTFEPGRGGLILLDFVPKGMSEAVRQRLDECGGLLRALCTVLPVLETVALVERPSTSSGLHNAKTGETFPHSGGKHLVMPVLDAADIPRFLADLHGRLWLAGFGWGLISAVGSFLERALIDRFVGTPEHLIFEGPPILEAPLEQEARAAVAHDGAVLDTRLCLPLTDGEKNELHRLRAAESDRLRPERDEARERWSISHIERLTAGGLSEAAARARVDRWIDRKELSGPFPLPFDDPEIAGTTVEQVLAAPDKYVNKTLADPFEGADYGRDKAKLLRRAHELLFIKSFAHGGIDYELKAASVEDDTELERLARLPPLVLTLDHFRGFMRKKDTCILLATGELWPSANVNKRVPPVVVGVDEEGKPIKLAAASWLARHRPCEQMSWAPGEPRLIRDKLIIESGWIACPGATVFNLYLSPTITRGDPTKAEKWLGHLRRAYPGDADHTVRFFAHAVQKPQEKVNHALLLGGRPGIGKDSLLAPIREAVGTWNFVDISPKQILGTRFNGYLRSVVLRISEAHDLGDANRFSFSEHLKGITASPPEALRIDEKNTPEHYIPNLCHVVITTNHRFDCLYLRADDRRTYVAWSEETKENFSPGYWTDLWTYYQNGGFGHVAAHLATLDLSDFDPKAPPPQTEAFWDIVNAGRAPEDAELADVIDKLGEKDKDGKPIPPVAVTLANVMGVADEDFEKWLKDRRNRRIIPHRFEAYGYTPVRNKDATDGLWRVCGVRQVIYTLADLTPGQRRDATRAIAENKQNEPLQRSAFDRLRRGR